MSSTTPAGTSAGELCTVFENKRLTQSNLELHARAGDRVTIDHRFEYVSKYGVGANDDAYWCGASMDDSRAPWTVEADRYPCLKPSSEASAAVVSVTDDSPTDGFAKGYSLTLDIRASGTLYLTFDSACLAGVQGAPVDTANFPVFSYSLSTEGT